MKAPLFEKDILYKTDTQKDPGSVRVRIYPPNIAGSVPLLVEQKSAHDPLEYVGSIVDMIQSDIFDRMQINVKKQGILYFKKIKEAGFYRLKFSGERYLTEETENPEL